MKRDRHSLVVGMLFALVLCSVCRAQSSDVRVKVIYVDDGDTVIVMLQDHSKVNVRLSSIDAPESSHENKQSGRVGQPYSEKSKNYLASMVKGETVDAKCFEVDVHHRQVCELFLGGKSVNREMVKAGFAWANLSANGRYLRDKALPGMEDEARAAKRGLWAAAAKPVQPWVWRKACWEQSICQVAE